MIIIGSSLTAQDTIKQNIAELWWNDSVEIINKRNVTLSHDDALTLIRNQQVSTNCWSDFYRYSQNIQQPSGELITCFPFTDCKIIKVDSNKFNVVSTKNIATGKDEKKKLFSYKIIDQSEIRDKENDKLSQWFNMELKISEVLFQDTLKQFVDECHKRYTIRFLSDGTFVQGYNMEVNCSCKISNKDFKNIRHIGFSEFDTARHSLFGLSGDWKLVDGKMYLKFDSGNIYKYDYRISEGKLIIKNFLTTIELATAV